MEMMVPRWDNRDKGKEMGRATISNEDLPLLIAMQVNAGRRVAGVPHGVYVSSAGERGNGKWRKERWGKGKEKGGNPSQMRNPCIVADGRLGVTEGELGNKRRGTDDVSPESVFHGVPFPGLWTKSWCAKRR